jgi:hypothetical protein
VLLSPTISASYIPVLEGFIAQKADSGRQQRETDGRGYHEQKLDPDGAVPE